MEYDEYPDELNHHGVKGMRWGVRRSKTQLAKLTKRNRDDISDEEAKDFRKDVKRYKRNSDSPSMRLKLYKKANSKYGKAYADAVMKKSMRDRAISTLAGTATVAAGYAAVSTYIKRKYGIVNMGDGTTLYMYPNG